MTFWYRTDPDPRIRTTSFGIRILFVSKLFCLFLFVSTFTSVFKDKISKRIHSIVESRFLKLFFSMMEGYRSGSVQIMTDTDPAGPKTYNAMRYRLANKRFFIVLFLFLPTGPRFSSGARIRDYLSLTSRQIAAALLPPTNQGSAFLRHARFLKIFRPMRARLTCGQAPACELALRRRAGCGS